MVPSSRPAGDLADVTVATMRLRNLAVSALGLLLVVGCSSDVAPAADRIREVASSAGATQIGWVDVSPTAVQLYYLDGDQPKVATKTSGDVTTSSAATEARFLTKPAGPDQLRLDEFTARLDGVQGCTDGTYGSINVTHAGAVLQQVGCSEGQGGTLKEAYLDGQELAPIDGWTEASLAAQLEEFASLIGDQGQQLSFYTPRSSTQDAGYRATAMSAAVKGIDGQQCFVQARRAGTMPDDGSGWVTYQACEGATPLGDTPFAMGELSAAKMLAALGRGAEKLKISVEDIGDFTVISTGGQLTVQLQVAQGVTAESPIWAEPIV